MELGRQHAPIAGEIAGALRDLTESGTFILGGRVKEFEDAFAAWCGAARAIGVNSGTSALHLALLAAGVGRDDEVITTAFTFMATAAAIAYTGARPVFTDISPETFTLDPAKIEARITPRTKAIVPVHLYGHPADMDPILEIARRYNLAVIEDAAQAHGSEYKGRRAGVLGDAACFSFYPSKNLGACGEAGIVVTNRAEWADRIGRLRDWGEGAPGQRAVWGYNCRMEAFQGAVLGIKLRYLDGWNAERRRIAECYGACGATPALQLPSTKAWAKHAFHIFAVRSGERDRAQMAFHERGIETRVHYPVPVHLMSPFAEMGYAEGDLPETERAAREVLSIPVHQDLDDSEVNRVCEALKAISGERAGQ